MGIALICITVVLGILCLIGCLCEPEVKKTEGNSKNSNFLSSRKVKALGDDLAQFILITSKDNEGLNTSQEKLEMSYLLLMEADRLVFAKYPEQRPQIFNRMLAGVLLAQTVDKKAGQRALDEYNDRILLYMSCKELIGQYGATVGSRCFVLSHFLQKARGKTSGKDITELLTSKRAVQPTDMDEFLDPFEGMALSMLLVQTIAGMKRLVDTL